ncbi:DUF2529 family protein [Niallia nealsonii]|uniref:DUF2529 domain-containing protein n=1 Tax=Niallia nealsonii TaxID=115979 RepID=A0A2N0YXM9_9BACI|nr:DUF2529 family protein [Niallia nealsonii]PKG22005.1 DUF2529 domain-containing protein [Niallia nealsonii]
MLKMFSTQLSGLFKRIQDKEEEMEDIARLLAQAIVGDGKIYLMATNEMEGVIYDAIEGPEPLFQSTRWNKDDSFLDIAPNDRFLLISRTSQDNNLLGFAKKLYEQHIPFAAISTIMSQEEGIHEFADIHIDLALKKGLLPDEDGNRFGNPSLIGALFTYHGIKFILNEIISELDL